MFIERVRRGKDVRRVCGLCVCMWEGSWQRRSICLLIFEERCFQKIRVYSDRNSGGVKVAMLIQERLTLFTENTFEESLRAYVLAVNLFFHSCL